jgi:hypothetical protein
MAGFKAVRKILSFSDFMKARRDWRKVRREWRKHVSASQEVLSAIPRELSAIPRELSTIPRELSTIPRLRHDRHARHASKALTPRKLRRLGRPFPLRPRQAPHAGDRWYIGPALDTARERKPHTVIWFPSLLERRSSKQLPPPSKLSIVPGVPNKRAGLAPNP